MKSKGCIGLQNESISELMKFISLRESNRPIAVAAFEEFRKRFESKIRTACYFTAKVHPSILSAQDLFQSIMLKVYTRAETFKQDPNKTEYQNLMNWISSIARNEFYGTQRGRIGNDAGEVNEELTSDFSNKDWRKRNHNYEEIRVMNMVDGEMRKPRMIESRTRIIIMNLPKLKLDAICAYLCNYPKNIPPQENTLLCKRHDTTNEAMRKSRKRILTQLIVEVLEKTPTERLMPLFAFYKMSYDLFIVHQAETLEVLAGCIATRMMNEQKHEQGQDNEKDYVDEQSEHIIIARRVDPHSDRD